MFATSNISFIRLALKEKYNALKLGNRSFFLSIVHIVAKKKLVPNSICKIDNIYRKMPKSFMFGKLGYNILI